MNILVPSIPPFLKITQTLIEDVIANPVVGAKVIMGENLDVFQRVRLKICWNTPRVMDSSGFSSAKTKNMWIVSNLRALLFPGHIGAVYYPVFMTGQLTYWKYFNEVAARAPLYRAQLGRNRLVGVDGKSGEEGKATGKGPSCWECNYKNDAQILMPAPGFLQGAKTQAGLRFNDLYVDEWTKVEAMSAESDGIDDQLVGRTTRHCFNKSHGIHRNHHLFLATAEDRMHPAYDRYESYRKEEQAGNPDYYTFSFCHKDYSDEPYKGDKSFRDEFREELVLKDMKKNKSPQGYLAEGIGVWGQNGKGLYTTQMLEHCYEIGAREKAEVICSRKEDPEGLKAYYFLGVDPAKADNKKADDGALVSLRAMPLIDDAKEPSQFHLSFNWAYRVRKADAPQWSAIIHLKHRHFQFAGIGMDGGGGGIWIRPELKKTNQLIRGSNQLVRPIACLEDEADTMVMGEFILSMFKPLDIRIQQVWGDMNMRGLDNLTDLAHTEFTEGLRQGIGFPLQAKKRNPEELKKWRDEKLEAAKLVELIGAQLLAISVRTEDDGTTYYSKQGARSFSSKKRKDFAYAGMIAWLRFLMWLRKGENDVALAKEDAALCGGN